jgi:hypothetical protein
MFVRLEFRTYDQTGQLSRRRQVTDRRRNDWMPPDRHRETLITVNEVVGWRDYFLDRRASESGVIVYRQMMPQPVTEPA